MSVIGVEVPQAAALKKLAHELVFQLFRSTCGLVFQAHRLLASHQLPARKLASPIAHDRV